MEQTIEIDDLTWWIRQYSSMMKSVIRRFRERLVKRPVWRSEQTHVLFVGIFSLPNITTNGIFKDHRMHAHCCLVTLEFHTHPVKKDMLTGQLNEMRQLYLLQLVKSKLHHSLRYF